MNGFFFRYATLLGTTVFIFGNFVACGSQLYQVALTEDVDARSVPKSAADPSSSTYGIHAADGWRELPIHFKTDSRLTSEQLEGLEAAMATWQTAVGRKLFVFEGVHTNTDGDSFRDLFSSLEDLVNGQYLDNNWAKTGKGSFVLATTIWDNNAHNHNQIVTADVRFNSNHYLLGDAMVLEAEGNREVVDMETLALHELGHLLGLAHVDAEEDPYSIMGPTLYIGAGLKNRRVSEDDIKRIQQIYGCLGSSCNVANLVAQMDRRAYGSEESAERYGSEDYGSEDYSTSTASRHPVRSEVKELQTH